MKNNVVHFFFTSKGIGQVSKIQVVICQFLLYFVGLVSFTLLYKYDDSMSCFQFVRLGRFLNCLHFLSIQINWKTN